MTEVDTFPLLLPIDFFLIVSVPFLHRGFFEQGESTIPLLFGSNKLGHKPSGSPGPGWLQYYPRHSDRFEETTSGLVINEGSGHLHRKKSFTNGALSAYEINLGEVYLYLYLGTSVVSTLALIPLGLPLSLGWVTWTLERVHFFSHLNPRHPRPVTGVHNYLMRLKIEKNEMGSGVLEFLLPEYLKLHLTDPGEKLSLASPSRASPFPTKLKHGRSFLTHVCLDRRCGEEAQKGCRRRSHVSLCFLSCKKAEITCFVQSLPCT